MGNLCSFSISTDNMISGCWAATSGQATYICEFPENLVAVKLALEDLRDFRTDMKRKIDTFEEQRLEQLDQVQRWFSRVEAVETEADQLIKEGTSEIHKLCLGGCCSKNFISSYRLGKKLAKNVEDINSLRSTKLFDMVAHRLAPASVDERPSEPTVGMMPTFSKVWSCLGEEKVGIIGLYGLGGVGKTTLLTQINNGFIKTAHNFDVVIWAVLSRDPDISKVQDEIWKKVGFCDGAWRNKTRDEKAIDIFRALRRKRFVLLLDDIWEPVSLVELGVPVPNQQNKCKLLFTTRSEDVCHQMEAQKNIKVECLAWRESWDLFQSKVGHDTLNSHLEIPMLAEMVARECCGLPLALVIIGRAMASKKTAEEWNYAVEVLQKAASVFPGMGDRVFPILKFSYDSLPTDAIKSCFLYCSLFPEDFQILKENLIDYWIGEGFLHEFDGFDGARNQGHNIIGLLLNACLLEKDTRYTVRMHDVVRDMALWIACEQGRLKDEFLVITRIGSIEAADYTRWVRPKRISLMKNRMEKLTGAPPPCSNLLTLFLDQNNLGAITRGFFQFIPHLRVLSLSRNRRLTYIPSEIGNLVSLHYLDVSQTNIRLLPIELKNLLNLKCLNLNFTPILNVIPTHLISSFSLLQVLRMYGCDFSDEVPNCSVLSGGNDDLLEELESLKQLHDLSITVESASALLRISESKLQNCTLEIYIKMFYRVKSLNMTSLENMKRLEKLCISDCSTLESLEVDYLEEETKLLACYDLHNSMVRSHKCFNSLKHVTIDCCPILKDLTWLIFAPNLIYLGVFFCPKMREVIMPLGEMENGTLFARLEFLILVDLPELKSIYRRALRVPHLKEIRVRSCPQLKKLPLDSDSTIGCVTVIYGDKYWANGLEWEDEDARHAFLPCFVYW